MSTTIDTNILVYASDESSPFHSKALNCVESLVSGSALVYLFWPVVMGYLRITTHPSIFAAPLSIEKAADNMERLLTRPHIQSIGELEGFWREFRAVSAPVKPRGNLMPDVHITTLMRQHGVDTILTHDTDFRKFSGLKVLDPLL